MDRAKPLGIKSLNSFSLILKSLTLTWWIAELADEFIGKLSSLKSRGKCLLSNMSLFSPSIEIEVKACDSSSDVPKFSGTSIEVSNSHHF